MTPFSNRVVRALSVASRQSAFSLGGGSAGFFRRLSRPTPAAADEPGRDIPIQIEAGLSANLRFFGQGADNATAAYRIWLGDAWPNGGDFFELAVTGTVTLSALTPSSADQLVIPHPALSVATGGQELRWADTATGSFTSQATSPPGPQFEGESAFAEGSLGVYSPGSDLAPAKVIIPHLQRASLMIVEFDLTGALAMNAIVTFTRP